MLAVGADARRPAASAGTRTIPIERVLPGPVHDRRSSRTRCHRGCRCPTRARSAGGAYLKLERKVGDFATVGVAVHVSFDERHGRTRRDRAHRRRAGATSRPTAAEQALAGRELDDEAIVEAARLAAEAAEPQDDVRGSAEYKRSVVRVFVERGLRAAAANGEERWLIRRSSPRRRRRTRAVTVTVNGEAHAAEVEPRLLLVHFLRETLGLTGTHIGCDTTNCGACTVLLDGTPVKSCTMLAVQADGHEVTTVEGLAQGGELHPIQEGFKRGARPPVRLLHARDDAPSVGAARRRTRTRREEEIRWALSGNLCRCTGYQNIVKAVQLRRRDTGEREEGS